MKSPSLPSKRSHATISLSFHMWPGKRQSFSFPHSKMDTEEACRRNEVLIILFCISLFFMQSSSSNQASFHSSPGLDWICWETPAGLLRKTWAPSNIPGCSLLEMLSLLFFREGVVAARLLTYFNIFEEEKVLKIKNRCFIFITLILGGINSCAASWQQLNYVNKWPIICSSL